LAWAEGIFALFSVVYLLETIKQDDRISLLLKASHPTAERSPLKKPWVQAKNNKRFCSACACAVMLVSMLVLWASSLPCASAYGFDMDVLTTVMLTFATVFTVCRGENQAFSILSSWVWGMTTNILYSVFTCEILQLIWILLCRSKEKCTF